jgi:hypothetical protein
LRVLNLPHNLSGQFCLVPSFIDCHLVAQAGPWIPGKLPFGMMAWQPEEQPLQQLTQFLKDSLSGQDKTAQKNAEIVRVARSGKLG